MVPLTFCSVRTEHCEAYTITACSFTITQKMPVNHCYISGGLINHPLVAVCLSELEWRLAEAGAVKTELEENPKKQIQDQLLTSIRCSVPSRRDSDESDED